MEQELSVLNIMELNAVLSGMEISKSKSSHSTDPTEQFLPLINLVDEEENNTAFPNSHVHPGNCLETLAVAVNLTENSVKGLKLQTSHSHPTEQFCPLINLVDEEEKNTAFPNSHVHPGNCLEKLAVAGNLTENSVKGLKLQTSHSHPTEQCCTIINLVDEEENNAAPPNSQVNSENDLENFTVSGNTAKNKVCNARGLKLQNRQSKQTPPVVIIEDDDTIQRQNRIRARRTISNAHVSMREFHKSTIIETDDIELMDFSEWRPPTHPINAVVLDDEFCNDNSNDKPTQATFSNTVYSSRKSTRLTRSKMATINEPNQTEIKDVNLECNSFIDLTCPTKATTLTEMTTGEDPTQLEINNTNLESKRILRKRIRPLDTKKVKNEKIQKMNKDDSVVKYYLNKKVKRLPNALETIFEEPKQHNNVEQYVSSRKFKRIIDFHEDLEQATKSKLKKRQCKAKKLSFNKKFLNRKKCDLDTLMTKLKNVESDNE